MGEARHSARSKSLLCLSCGGRQKVVQSVTAGKSDNLANIENELLQAQSVDKAETYSLAETQVLFNRLNLLVTSSAEDSRSSSDAKQA